GLVPPRLPEQRRQVHRGPTRRMPGRDDGHTARLDLEQVLLVDVPADGRWPVEQRDARDLHRVHPGEEVGEPQVVVPGRSEHERVEAPRQRLRPHDGDHLDPARSQNRNDGTIVRSELPELRRGHESNAHMLLMRRLQPECPPASQNGASASTHRSSQRTRSTVKAWALPLSTSTVPSTPDGATTGKITSARVPSSVGRCRRSVRTSWTITGRPLAIAAPVSPSPRE